MQCMPKSQASKRYAKRIRVAMTIYIIAILGSVYFLKHHPAQPLASLVALLPSLPILAMIAAIGMYLREEKDEFQRSVLQQCLLYAMGLTLAATSVWGLLELIVSVPHVPIFYTFPAFWFFVGVCTPFIRRQYRGSEADE